jgi:hypothetical protein
MLKQRGLADTGLATQHQDTAAAAARSIEKGLEGRALAFAAL